MPSVTTFTNNWKNIVNKLESVLKNEFKGTLNVYIGQTDRQIGSQYIQLNPIGSELLEYSVTGEKREYSVQILYYCLEETLKDSVINHIFRIVGRVESLILDNVNMTYRNESNNNETVFNCRLQSTDFNTEEENKTVVEWDWKCIHLANIS